MITRTVKDHVRKVTPTCGELWELLSGSEYSPNLALAIDIGTTRGHFHRDFDEIYLVVDGEITLELFDESEKRHSEQKLTTNELCVIPKGVHHRITGASSRNRLLVMSVPSFNPDDEHYSNVLLPPDCSTGKAIK